jgi:hypothetical protein
MTSNREIADTVRQMLNDWNNATEQQRQDALAAAKRLADSAEDKLLGRR